MHEGALRVREVVLVVDLRSRWGRSGGLRVLCYEGRSPYQVLLREVLRVLRHQVPRVLRYEGRSPFQVLLRQALRELRYQVLRVLRYEGRSPHQVLLRQALRVLRYQMLRYCRTAVAPSTSSAIGARTGAPLSAPSTAASVIAIGATSAPSTAASSVSGGPGAAGARAGLPWSQLPQWTRSCARSANACSAEQ